MTKNRGFVSKIIAGDSCRRTRFHDEKGNMPPISSLLINGSRACLSYCVSKIGNRRPVVPWISYRATRKVEEILSHASRPTRVLEFGSGMSTIWFSRNADSVVSVENFSPWYDKVKQRLKADEVKNVQYIFATNKEEYVSPNIDGDFDLLLVDGDYRAECLKFGIMRLKPDGVVYLDNTDKDNNIPGGSMRQAEEVALRFAAERKLRIVYYTDFAPAQLTANQGLMLVPTR